MLDGQACAEDLCNIYDDLSLTQDVSGESCAMVVE